MTLVSVHHVGVGLEHDVGPMRPEPGIEGPPVWMVDWMPYLPPRRPSARVGAILDAAEAHLAEELDASLGELLEILLGHPRFDYRRAGVELTRLTRKALNAPSEDGVRLQADDVARAPG